VPLVLAIEPDLRQAAIVKRIVREKVHADVAVVDSRDAALEAMRTTVPDVLLISALLSPRDEDELVAHLRTLDDADHLQTHTIPQLASSLGPGEERASRGLLSAFRRKKEPEGVPSGCDPDMFAEEVRSYLQRAADRKRERLEARSHGAPDDRAWRTATPGMKEPEPIADAPVEAASSSWASPFEWKPSSPSTSIAHPESRSADPEPRLATPEPRLADPEPRSAPSEPIGPESLMAHLRPPSGILSVDKLASAAAEPWTISEPLIAASSALAPEVEWPVVLDAPIVLDSPVVGAPPVLVAAVDAIVAAPPPVVYAAPIAIEEPPIVAAPSIVVEEPVVAAAAAPPIAPPPVVSAPPPSAAPMRAKDARSKVKDSGLGLRDQGLGIKDSRLGALATWVRAEHRGRGAAQEGDDVRGLLNSLAVPAAVVAVGYGRGCRIRRVRVPTAREPHESEAVGAVILSKRVLAEQRGRREQPASGV
jgi:CheY-like chemotaxis protein